MDSNRKTSRLELASTDACEFAIHRGVLVAVAHAVCVIVASVVYFTQVATPDWIVAPSVLAHVAVLSVLAVLVLRKNRVASIALLAYLLSSWVVLWWLGAPSGWAIQLVAALVAAVIVLFNSLAVVAIFRWHERSRTASLSGGVARAA